MQKFWVKVRFIEPYNPQQNPEEREAVGTQKGKLKRLMIDTGCYQMEWFREALNVSDVHNYIEYEKLGWAVPIEVRYLYTPYIVLLKQFKFWYEIYYYEDENENMKEARGKLLGRAQNYGD